MKFPLDTRVYVDSNATHDFYVMHCEREWYVEAYRKDNNKKTIGGFRTKKSALECVASWKGWMK